MLQLRIYIDRRLLYQENFYKLWERKGKCYQVRIEQGQNVHRTEAVDSHGEKEKNKREEKSAKKTERYTLKKVNAKELSKY